MHLSAFREKTLDVLQGCIAAMAAGPKEMQFWLTPGIDTQKVAKFVQESKLWPLCHTSHINIRGVRFSKYGAEDESLILSMDQNDDELYWTISLTFRTLIECSDGIFRWSMYHNAEKRPALDQSDKQLWADLAAFLTKQ